MALITREQDKMDNCDGQSNSVPMMGAGICVASHATDVQAVNAHLVILVWQRWEFAKVRFDQSWCQFWLQVSDGLAQTQDQRTRLEKELTSVRVQLSDKLAEISKLEEKLRTAQLAHQGLCVCVSRQLNLSKRCKVSLFLLLFVFHFLQHFKAHKKES